MHPERFTATVEARPRGGIAIRRPFDPDAVWGEYIRWIEQAKRPETRVRRIAETVAALKAGKRQH